MKAIACKECNLVIENKEPGTYYCENCAKEMKFFKIEAFCEAKPNELNEHEVNNLIPLNNSEHLPYLNHFKY